jgi:hypothetical protein
VPGQPAPGHSRLGPVADAVARLAADVEAAFDLLEQGIGDRYTR